MAASREDDLTQALVDLERRHHRLQCEYRRVCEALDWRDEKIRVLERVILRLGRDQPEET